MVCPLTQLFYLTQPHVRISRWGHDLSVAASSEDALPKAAVVADVRCREAGGCGGGAVSRQLQRRPWPVPSRPQRPRCVCGRLWRERSTYIPLAVQFAVCGPCERGPRWESHMDSHIEMCKISAIIIKRYEGASESGERLVIRWRGAKRRPLKKKRVPALGPPAPY